MALRIAPQSASGARWCGLARRLPFTMTLNSLVIDAAIARKRIAQQMVAPLKGEVFGPGGYVIE